MESAMAFDIIDSDDSEDGATTIAIRGQIDSVVNTLDTYDNPTSDSDNTQQTMFKITPIPTTTPMAIKTVM